MTQCHRFFISFLCAGLLGAYLPAVQADQYNSTPSINSTYTPPAQSEAPQNNNQSYGDKVSNKALNAVSNITTGILEVPKNTINTTNDSNIFYGITGGLFKGLLNTWGRMSVGISDLLTVLIPTKPVAYPLNVWDDVKTDTTYGNIMELDLPQKKQAVVIEAPSKPVAVAKPAVAPRLPVVDGSQTNKKIDTFFKKEMMK